jgi:seryl-tRNA synthetase
LSKNIDIQLLIAQCHRRTTRGINARRGEIAYKLYSNNTSMEVIILKTKLDEDQICEAIKKRQNNPRKYKSAVTEIKNPISIIESEICEIKNDIKELKNTIKELVEMRKVSHEDDIDVIV